MTRIREFLAKHPRIVLPAAALLVTVAVITAMWWFKPTPPKAENEEKSWPVRTVSLEKGAHAPQIRLLGEVDTPLNSTLTSPVNADVQALPHLEGERVEKGEPLVELDTRDAQLMVTQREADVAELQAQLSQERNRAAKSRRDLEQQQELVALAEAAVAREKRLQKSDLSSQARLDDARRSLASARLALNAQQLEVENAEARLNALEARLSRANAMLQQARLDLERAQMRAPFRGQITRIHVSPGERVRPGEPVVELFADHQLEVRAQLPQRWLTPAREALRSGQGLSASASIDGQQHALHLNRLAGAVNSRAGGVDALFRLQADTIAAPLGETVNVTLSLPPVENTYSLPVSALYGTQRIYRLSDGRLQGIEVDVLGNRYTDDGQHILVRSPQLAPDDRVITTQLPNAVNGLKVDVRNAQSEGASS